MERRNTFWPPRDIQRQVSQVKKNMKGQNKNKWQLALYDHQGLQPRIGKQRTANNKIPGTGTRCITHKRKIYMIPRWRKTNIDRKK